MRKGWRWAEVEFSRCKAEIWQHESENRQLFLLTIIFNSCYGNGYIEAEMNGSLASHHSLIVLLLLCETGPLNSYRWKWENISFPFFCLLVLPSRSIFTTHKSIRDFSLLLLRFSLVALWGSFNLSDEVTLCVINLGSFFSHYLGA